MNCLLNMEGENMSFLEDEKINKILLVIIVLLQIITISIVILCSNCYKKEEEKKVSEDIAIVNDVEIVDDIVVTENVRVDVKGAVKNPGVYELDGNSRVIDAIKLAGGTKSSASTKYLNLSKKITDEMVIYVYTNNQVKSMGIKEEIKEECKCPTIDTSICAGSNIIVSDKDDSTIIEGNTTNQENSNKVSLNKASKDELMTLSGVGESKALAIIEYRDNNGGFKVLEEVMNVSGIGEALYNKIKDYITL